MTPCPRCDTLTPNERLWPCNHLPLAMSVCDACRYAVHLVMVMTTPVGTDMHRKLQLELEAYDKAHTKKGWAPS